MFGISLCCFCYCYFGAVVKPQWKAAIDFKWIRGNKAAVADNINNRKSNANLELVLDLYERLLSVQKVRILLYLCSFSDSILPLCSFFVVELSLLINHRL